MRKPLSPLRHLLGLCLLVVGTASYAQHLQAGLWEISTQMRGGQADKMAASMEKMQKDMASMPPEQRKMVQDMMAKQGVQMGAAGGAGITAKICMSQEMVSRNDFSGQRGDCSHTTSPRMGNTIKYSFVCTKPASSGEGEISFQGRDAYTQKMTVTTTVKGKPEKMDMQSRGKWLGNDCGKIKPIAMPAK
ncbi:MAG: DUF3617 domain-containing protein [Rhodoferax sp.]|nr:DUF3617 domain-containing protein [Rhodoferax sp.]